MKTVFWPHPDKLLSRRSFIYGFGKTVRPPAYSRLVSSCSSLLNWIFCEFQKFNQFCAVHYRGAYYLALINVRWFWTSLQEEAFGGASTRIRGLSQWYLFQFILVQVFSRLSGTKPVFSFLFFLNLLLFFNLLSLFRVQLRETSSLFTI